MSPQLRSSGSRLTALGATLLLATAAPAVAPGAAAAQDRPALTWTDLMRIRQVEDPSISADGRWLAFTAAPDRGDPEVVVRAVDGGARFTVATADDPAISVDGAWVAARIVPSLQARETDREGPPLRNGVALMALPSGEVETIADVRAFAFSPDGRWLALHRYAPRDDEAPDDDVEAGADDEEDDLGTTLELRDLRNGTSRTVPHVRSFAFSDDGALVATVVGSPVDAEDGAWVHDLGSGTVAAVHTRADGVYGDPTWGEHAAELAVVVAEPGEIDGRPARGEIVVWRPGTDADTWVGAGDAPEGWFVPVDADLVWSDDGARLFFAWRPLRADERATAEPDDEPAFDPHDPEQILDGRGVDVWHWRDPRIMTQQKVVWDREKDRTYRAVRHRDGAVVRLGDLDLPDVRIPESGSPVALATSDLPYRWESTWTGGADDAYLVDLATGARTLVAEALGSAPSLSPGGRFVVWWDDAAWWIHDVAAGDTRELGADIDAPLADEDWDYPDDVPGYGVAAWMDGDDAVILRDKYDLWVVPTDGSPSWSLTGGQGRAERRVFRLEDVEGPIAPGQELLLQSYHDLRKNYGFYRARAGEAGVTRLLEDDKRFVFLARADSADRVLFTREAYDEFPDLWVAEPDFTNRSKVTDVNPGLTDRYAWGSAELVEWRSLDGIPLQGVVIKPGNYEEGRRYPVLVYYYRFFSQRLHEFNDPSVNHRPSFPVYASDDYVVFLPDVRFEVGSPGLAATKSVVPGVQKLIEMGLADPDGVALHGHSWSGYQTAFIVTQTDLFATAVAGAPVANMTSAYSGIRLGSGLARQFQYEKTQSRIGGSLWENFEEYVENSPVFYADRIETPLLILHGDVDDAVPWEQSIELYLALRRLGKETVFLQYRDEPHHPQRYANKLDWSIRMKEWIDHYTKGTPAPAWMTDGVPYTGN